jgi:hypothetical protein
MLKSGDYKGAVMSIQQLPDFGGDMDMEAMDMVTRGLGMEGGYENGKFVSKAPGQQLMQQPAQPDMGEDMGEEDDAYMDQLMDGAMGSYQGDYHDEFEQGGEEMVMPPRAPNPQQRMPPRR